MELQDLKDGMLVHTRNGNIYLVMRGRLLRQEGYQSFSCYNDDLTFRLQDNGLDIMQVSVSSRAFSNIDDLLGPQYYVCIWERTQNFNAFDKVYVKSRRTGEWFPDIYQRKYNGEHYVLGTDHGYKDDEIKPYE